MMTAGRRRGIALAAVAVVAALAGLGAGYALWSPPDWYANRTPDTLPAGPENDLVREGWQIVLATPRHIGPLAADPASGRARPDRSGRPVAAASGFRAAGRPAARPSGGA